MESFQSIKRMKDKKKKACLRGITREGPFLESGLVILILE
jgi:hypothetical protein